MARAAKKQDDNVIRLANNPSIDPIVSLNLGKIIIAQDNAASKHGELRNVLKHAEGKGINLKAAKRAIALKKSGNVDEWLAETAKVVEYLFALGHGVEEQQMTFDFLLNRSMPGEEKARLFGRLAGLRGDGDGENPYAVGSPQHNAWIDGHNDGARERRVAEADELIKGADADDDTGSEDPGFEDDELEAAE